MSDEVLSEMTRQYEELRLPVSGFCWQGGEPTVAGLGFFRQAVQLESRWGAAGQRVANSLQTNGLVIDDEWARFLAEYHFLVGLSIDGPPDLHDGYRRDREGRGSFERGWEVFERLGRHGVETNILSVVTQDATRRGREILEFFVKRGVRFLQFISCVEVDPMTRRLRDFSVRAQSWGRFLCDLFDAWYVEDGLPQVSIRLFEDVLSAILTGQTGSCEFRRDCSEYVVIEHNGDVYPCDFVVEKEWLLGNVMQKPLVEILGEARWQEFCDIKPRKPRPCLRCRFDWLCQGGCPKLRRTLRGCWEDPSPLCPAYKKFFAYTESRFQRLAERVRKRQEPAAIGRSKG